jgi:transposase
MSIAIKHAIPEPRFAPSPEEIATGAAPSDARMKGATVGANELLTSLLSLPDTRVMGFHLDEEALVLDVCSTSEHACCAACARRAVPTGETEERPRVWRHTEMGTRPVLLRAVLRRVSCDECGEGAELAPWT